jgi:HKD family nuclease
MIATNSLIWSPVFETLREYAAGRRIAVAVSPFIQRHTIDRLLRDLSWASGAMVITRWGASDIASGVSDIEVFPLLAGKGISMRIQESLHMKMFLFEDGSAVVSSANITDSGLGINERFNLELGVVTQLSNCDSVRVASLITSAVQVTEDVYRRAKKYVSENSVDAPQLPPLKLVQLDNGNLANECGSLPPLSGVEALWLVYNSATTGSKPAADLPLSVALEDLARFKLEPHLSRSEFDAMLRDHVQALPIVGWLLEGLARGDTYRFGEVVDKMQSLLKPSTSLDRKTLKAYARSLYDWLPWIDSKVYWDRPRHSMILKSHE